MSLTATSPPAIAAEKLRQMVASSATFQAAVGASDRDGGLRRVRLREVADGGERPVRPQAIVSMGDSFHFRLIAGGDRNELRPDGTLFLFLDVDTPEQFYDDQVAAEWHAWNFFGDVLTDVAELAAADDTASAFGESHLSITDLEVVGWGGSAIEDENSLGRFYHAAIRVQWGDGD